MRGGVDSSVAGPVMKEQGHDVAAITMRIWSEKGKKINIFPI